MDSFHTVIYTLYPPSLSELQNKELRVYPTWGPSGPQPSLKTTPPSDWCTSSLWAQSGLTARLLQKTGPRSDWATGSRLAEWGMRESPSDLQALGGPRIFTQAVELLVNPQQVHLTELVASQHAVLHQLVQVAGLVGHGHLLLLHLPVGDQLLHEHHQLGRHRWQNSKKKKKN